MIKIKGMINNVKFFLKECRCPSLDVSRVKSNKIAFGLVVTLVLLNIFGVTMVSNLYLLGYFIHSYIEYITKHNNDSDLLIIFGCFYSSHMFLESVLFKFMELKFELLVIKLFFYTWAFHPSCNGYIQIYNHARNWLNITTKKTEINENILIALEQLENNQTVQTHKLQQVFEFYEKLNEDLDKYEKFNNNLFNDYKVNEDDTISLNSVDSLYVHPPSELSIIDEPLEVTVEKKNGD